MSAIAAGALRGIPLSSSLLMPLPAAHFIRTHSRFIAIIVRHGAVM